MARNATATFNVARATFLLEMALDRAQMKERLARVLLEERTKRGHGDPRRFPQPEMARLLSVALRTYQRWEAPDDPMLPYWRNLEQIAATLDRDLADLVGDADQDAAAALVPATDRAEEVADLQGRGEIVQDKLVLAVQALLNRIDSERAERRSGEKEFAQRLSALERSVNKLVAKIEARN